VPRLRTAWSYTSTLQYIFVAWCLVRAWRLYLYDLFRCKLHLQVLSVLICAPLHLIVWSENFIIKEAIGTLTFPAPPPAGKHIKSPPPSPPYLYHLTHRHELLSLNPHSTCYGSSLSRVVFHRDHKEIWYCFIGSLTIYTRVVEPSVYVFSQIVLSENTLIFTVFLLSRLKSKIWCLLPEFRLTHPYPNTRSSIIKITSMFAGTSCNDS